MTSQTVYQFKPQSRLRGDAQAVGEAIERIIEEKGTAGPSDLVDAAREKDSPLHPYFTWTNAEAARKYREQEARHLLRSIVAVRSEAIPIDAPVRAFVAIRAAQEDAEDDAAGEEDAQIGSYTTITNAVRTVRYREQMIVDAMRDLDAYRLKYQLLADLIGWGDALSKARAFLESAISASQREAA